MKTYRKLIVCLVVSLVLATNISVFATETPIKLFLNDSPMSFDVPPLLIDQRVLVPFRALFEALGAEVIWDNEKQTAYASTANLLITMPLNKPYAGVNGLQIPLDVPAIMRDNRVLVPVRFVAETLGAKVNWVNATQSVYLASSGSVTLSTSPPSSNTAAEPKPANLAPSQSIVKMGDSLDTLLAAKGQPDRKDSSQYGFTWYIYNKDYSKFDMIGIRNNSIVARYQIADFAAPQGTVKIGATTTQVRGILGQPISSITRGSTIFDYKEANIDLFYHNQRYTRIFYDKFNNGRMKAYFTVNANEELNLKGYYGTPSTALKESFERQLFDLTNASRAAFNLPLLTWAPEVVASARAHSEDMVKRKFFEHTNPDGLEPYQRLQATGIAFQSTAENLAAGQIDAIFAHEALMNSEGHRKNILSKQARLGVGFAFGGNYSQYFTATFYTPQ